jgi:hypothetical protein
VTALWWLLALAGFALVAATALDISGSLVVPRRFNSRSSNLLSRVVGASFFTVLRPVDRYERRDAVLAWAGPVVLLARLVLWVSALTVGFALMLVPSLHGHIGRAFSEAGSSVFTLGYRPPHSPGSTVIDYFAAYSGLLVIALQIGYLPSLYAGFNRRETEVTMLDSRAGAPAWGPELLVRTRYGLPDGDVEAQLDDLFGRWERWSAEVSESHTAYPTLVFLRSPRTWSHWLTAQLAVLDAAALVLALQPSSSIRLRARLCLRMGFVALQDVARTLGIDHDAEPEVDAPIQLTREDFLVAVGRMEAVGYPIEADLDEAWLDFRGWRTNYEAAAYGIAYAIDAPPAMWSGPRRWTDEAVAPMRPSVGRAKRPATFPTEPPTTTGQETDGQQPSPPS